MVTAGGSSGRTRGPICEPLERATFTDYLAEKSIGSNSGSGGSIDQDYLDDFDDLSGLFCPPDVFSSSLSESPRPLSLAHCL